MFFLRALCDAFFLRARQLLARSHQPTRDSLKDQKRLTTMLSATLRRFTLIASRRGVSSSLARTVVASSSVLAPAVAAHFSTKNAHEKHDVEDESDIIELAKEEEEEMQRGPDYEEFAAKVRAHSLYRRHNDVGYDVEDESDLLEVAKEEEQDMAKGVATKKRVHLGKLVVDIEDESDVIEYEKTGEGVEDDEARIRAQRASAASKRDGIDHDIEDESDIIELAKDEVEEMEKK
jgi:hypothetical protein